MKPKNIRNLIAASTRMNTTLNSSAIPVYEDFAFSIQIFFTGTPTGSFKLQASDDIAFGGVPNAGGSGVNAAAQNWTDVASSSFTVSAAGNVMWDYSSPGFNWVRVVYTDSSSGASTAIITTSTFNGKGF